MKLQGVVNYSWGAFGVEIKKVIVWERYNVPPPEIDNIAYFLNIYGSKIINVIGNICENPELL